MSKRDQIKAFQTLLVDSPYEYLWSMVPAAYNYIVGGSTGDKTTDAILDAASSYAYDAGSAVYNKVFSTPEPETALVTP